MIKNIVLSAILSLTSVFAFAHNIVVGQPVPVVSVTDKGELLLNNDKFSYQNWNSTELPGKVRTIQHIAGRSSAKEMNDPLIQALKQADLPKAKYQTTSIVNTDDAIFGTSVFVRNSLEDSKKEFPWSQFIVDSEGLAKKAWGLEPKSSAIIVLDKNGNVKFVKDGKLSNEDITHVLNLIKEELNN
ncbi:YtfJ family protein [Xenorhabdus bovienii]|uniref:YtfJ family protein n=1 Tax=Xenorhabdus bovienii TaxID=40576 RepID=UPI00237C7738|nr:YtfJ family protein [Xenorhabdus bovienii]MDE1473165.1 YtfJ family protein [Xenorhabdus bovienii]MDE9428292.1 YtfJ family protein [Xenorhabdus bovienii]MDE9432262.1 YtfJ family protein [Xenorhabdus bovienii]MDE9490223.1 YtfJ family protein [Xenorhabdus bovienii]MDE9492108.1 YtfJ family protein [Xenorhabdus bovienii]